jgi:hypothetical protein
VDELSKDTMKNNALPSRCLRIRNMDHHVGGDAIKSAFEVKYI